MGLEGSGSFGKSGWLIRIDLSPRVIIRNKMQVESYSFGRIRIEGKEYLTDLWVVNGGVERRLKNISRSKFGTSHKVSKEEVERIVTPKTRRVIIGKGSSGLLSLSEDARAYLEGKGIALEEYRSSELEGKNVGIGDEDSAIIHLTC